MLNQRIEVARNVTKSLHETEFAIDDALIKAADLVKTTMEARREARLSVAFGHEAVTKIGDSMRMMFEARSIMVEAHNSLAETRDDLRIPAKASGDLWDKPDLAHKVDEPTLKAV